MAYKCVVWCTARVLALAALVASSGVLAQGYEVQPWPARKPLPPLTATDLTGQVWRLADLRGKAVLINFWASWCEPCRAEMPSLQALAQQHGPDRLVVLAINFKESTAATERFVQQTQLNLPVLRDPQGEIARQWGVKVFPSTVLIDTHGRVRGVLKGELDWTGAQAAALVMPLLAPRQPEQPLRR